ncbi:MAG: Abi family protein, partial [Amoebophilaceae bacterium]|nr:Abi family protein [Amoebophilaceae bacterium]
MTSYSKLPTTPQQQIQQLKDEGLIISDTSKAEKLLEDIAYYRLRAYWIIFEASSNPRTFKPNIKFEDVINLYLFDEDLRNLIFSAITKIEISLRATFSNLSINFNAPHFYLDSNNFKRYGIHLESLYKIKRTINNNKDELFIAHYLTKYSQPELPPVWSVVETLTIGELQYWITNLK